MNDCFATRLVIGIFIAGVLLLAVFPLIRPPFVGPLVGTTPQHYVEDLIVGKLHARHVVVGEPAAIRPTTGM